MRVVLHPKAIANVEAIFDWIVKDRPAAARSVVERIFTNIDRLGERPYIGRVGRSEGTREWLVPGLPYIIVYTVDAAADSLRVLAVFHTAQDR